MFRHGYLFHDFLAEAGPLNDGKVRSHRCLQLIFGVNKPFRIRAGGVWQECRICLIAPGVDHFISGEEDWQLCCFFYPDSPLGILFSEQVLKGAALSVLSREENPARIRTLQPAVRPISPEDIRGLLESLVFVFTGRRASPVSFQNTALRVRKAVLSADGGQDLSLKVLASRLGRDLRILEDEFKRETLMNLRIWVMHHRMILFFEKLESAAVFPDLPAQDRMARDCGIAGLTGLDRIFEDFFGMPYSRWVNSSPGTVILGEKKPVFLSYI